MAQVTSPQRVPSQSEESTPVPGSPIAPEVLSQPEESTPIPESPITSENLDAHPLSSQIATSPGCGSSSWLERGREWLDSARRAVIVTVSSNQSPFWRAASSRIANTCAVLGLLLAVTFGVTQWVAQDKSIAIAKESELITLALSCSDEEIKNTTICQQFLEKYPNGPVISRREIASADYSHHNDSGIEPMHTTIENIAVHLAMMDRFFQKQSSRFHSALIAGDPGLSLAHIEDIIESEKFFLQYIAASKTTLAHQRAGNADPSLTPLLVKAITELPRAMTKLIIAVGRPLLSIILIRVVGSICILVIEFMLRRCGAYIYR
ncbi:hypothetical protein F4782DRAFT_398672 [Xylaria castorea]|nr:hypothetical protein F4782DRAFT_398672 [Xylaria castorea]